MTNNVLNQKENNIKQNQSKHEHLEKLEIGSGVMEE